MSEQKKTIVVHDTDVHGSVCGINALYSLINSGIDVDVFSHFSINPNEPSTTPSGLSLFIENLGNADLIILDIPIDVRNPKRYIDTLVSHAQYKGRVVWADHHGHSQWIDVLNRNGVVAIVVSSSYELSLLVPRMYGKLDKYTEKWAIIGAVADFDETIASRVSTDLEIDVAEYLDQAFKFYKSKLAEELGIGYRYSDYIAQRGNVGSLTYAIAEKAIEPEQVIDVAKSIVQPIQVPSYRTVGDVVYTIELPKQGLAWKTAWKLCAITQAKVAVVPAYNPRTDQYSVIIAKNWRTPEVTDIIEQYVQRKFAAQGRQVVGHPGARSISMMSYDEARETIRCVASELAELISSHMYTPSTVRLINESTVARALHNDFTLILEKITEVLYEMRKMYKEYLELKRRQVELLEQNRDTRYD